MNARLRTISGGVLFVALCALFVQTISFHRVEARATFNFPNASHSSNGVPTAAVGIRGAQGGGNSELQADRAEFQVEVDVSGTVKVTIVDACYTGSSAGNPTGGYYSMNVSVKGGTPKNNGTGWIDRTFGDCNTSNGDIVFDNVDMAGSKTMTIVVNKVGGPGIKAFKVNVTPSGSSPVVNPTVSYDEDSSKAVSGQPAKNAFALFGSGTVEFEFKLPCTFPFGTTRYMKWFDADDGTAGIQSSSLYWTIVDLTTGSTIATRNDLGVDNTYGEQAITGFVRDHRYAWRWHNVDGVNGVQLWMPYSENTAEHAPPCTPPPPPPPSTFNATCDIISFGIPANASAEEAPADATNNDRYRVWVNDSASPGINPAVDAPDFGDSVAEGTTVTYDLVATNKIHPGVLSFHIEIHKNSDIASPVIKVIDYSTPGNCYTAACEAFDVAENFSNAPENAVLAGSQIFITFVVRNTGINDLPAGLPPNQALMGVVGPDLSDPIWANATQPLGQPIASGQLSVPVTMVLTAPSDRSARFMYIAPVYPGVMTLGAGNCNMTISTYQEFSLTATAGLPLANDPENPESITYSNTITQNSGPSEGIPATATSRLFYRTFAGAVIPADLHNGSGSNRFITRNLPGTWNDSFVPAGDRRFNHGITSTWQPGDQYCTLSQVDPASGFIGPGDAIANGAPSPATESCGRVVNRPFVRNYMGDVTAGGQFDGSSVVGAGAIKTFTKGSNTAIGSGVEFAAEAMSTITGFSSAFLRTAAPTNPFGLSFANNSPVGACSATVPGCFRGNPPGIRQVYNFFDGDMTAATRAGGSSNPGGAINLHPLNTLPRDNGQSWFNSGGAKLPLTFNGVGARYNISHEIFVDGDVFIQNDIIYSDGPWTNISQIPNLRLVVKGDIYISRDVDQLDGLYVAQPKAGGGGGNIYTCANSAGNVPADPNLYDECSVKKLQINGGLVAQNIDFLRTIWTLSDAPIVGRETYANDHAAESFRLSPDYFLGIPAADPIGGQNNGKYDDIKTLPPVL